MIHKKMKYRVGSGATLSYVYREAGGQTQRDGLYHLCSQMVSAAPVSRDKTTGKIRCIRTSHVANELDFVAAKNSRSKKKMAHYVLSLPSGERLKKSDWRYAVRVYMRAMGYNTSTKWTAALHDENDAQHAHIVACRVQNSMKYNYTLVNDKGDYKRGMRAMRKIEKRLGLKPTPNPRDTWGRDMPKSTFEKIVYDFEQYGEAEMPWHQAIIARLSEAVGSSRGKTFTDFLENCEKVGVQPIVRLNDQHYPTGISYAYRGRSASGYRLKSDRLTFAALTGQVYSQKDGLMLRRYEKHEGIHYEQERDIQACHRGARTIRAERSKQQNLTASAGLTNRGEFSGLAAFLKDQGLD